MLNLDEALTYTSGTKYYQKRLTFLFGLGQIAIAFLVMGIPLMFPEFDEICDKSNNCQIPSKYADSASAELSVYGENKSKISYIGSSYFSGMMIFSLIISWLSDNKGRKTVVFFSAIICSCIIFLLAFSWNFNVVVFAYFIFGGAELGVYCSGFILLTESVEPSQRNIFSGAALCTWGIGSIILMLLFMSGLYWRVILSISFFIMFSYIFLLRYILESPRWLFQSNLGLIEVKKVLSKISVLNGRGEFDLDLKMKNENNGKTYTYLIFLQNKELMKTVILCILIWLNVVLVY
jgi:MFS family permease